MDHHNMKGEGLNEKGIRPDNGKTVIKIDSDILGFEVDSFLETLIKQKINWDGSQN